MSRHLRSTGPHAAQPPNSSSFELFAAPLHSFRLTPFPSNPSALFHSCCHKPIFSALCFQAVAHSSKMCIPATPFASATSALFAKNWGVGGGTSFNPKSFGSFRSGSPSFRLSDGTFPNTLLDLRSHPREYRYCQNVATARPPHPSYGCQVRWVADGGDT